MAYSAYYMQRGRSPRTTDWASVVVFGVVGFSVALALLSLTYMVVTGIDPTSLVGHEPGHKPVPRKAKDDVQLGEDACRDRLPACSEWAAAGECDTNRAFMIGDKDSLIEGQCCKACGKCLDCWTGGVGGGGEMGISPDPSSAAVGGGGGGQAQAEADDPDADPAEEDDEAVSTPAPEPAITILTKPCKDELDKCGEWAGIGECEANTAYMVGDREAGSFGQCCKACGKCGEDCYLGDEYVWTKVDEKNGNAYWFNEDSKESTRTDPYNRWEEHYDDTSGRKFWSNPYSGQSSWENPNDVVALSCADLDESCARWAGEGFCESNAAFMIGHSGLGNEGHCCASCNSCDSCWITSKSQPASSAPPMGAKLVATVCKDVIPDCPQWAASGYCDTNRGYMLGTDKDNIGHCCKSCSACGEGCWINAGPLGESA